MRLLNLLKGDVSIQFKYGFYYIFMLFSFLYIVLIKVLPISWQGITSAIFIFTDPTALGLIFMGAIIHFEISEKTLNSICISPISPLVYLISKLFSIALLATLSGLFIGLVTQTISSSLSFIVGLFLGSIVFSALGIILAFKTSSMNQFILSIIPIMILIILPGVANIVTLESGWYVFHPGIAISELLINGNNTVIAIFSLLLWLIIFLLVALKIVKKRFKQEMGAC